MKPAWLICTIEELENDYSKCDQNTTFLVTRCYELRKKILKNFEVEDFRIMIGQNIALMYLIPLALAILEENCLAEGNFYPGDLLRNVLRSETEFWKNNSDYAAQLAAILQKNQDKIRKESQELAEIAAAWQENLVLG